MQTAWFQRILMELGALPRELGRLPEYAAEAERLHLEIHVGEERVAASREKPLLPSVVDTRGGWPAPGL
jgi:hypothetical protein